ncbi:cation diffusion facilitator family transporter [Micromonospora sp. U21]|uniref:cation diffusion facilitator family transporter n=1 Tax=Micromonospora sp. U21 TaxID=2824899 RepID=UPI001FFD9B29|nr:cation diffusion facilitator family transporter [Micromonospora sp. U21]
MPQAIKTESVGTVVVAGAANLAIAVAKLIAGLISGSAAMLSEAAHSVADTTTEVLLYQALRRGARPADSRHPFGYGKESYVWAFFAAMFTFVAGAGFAVTHGVTTILVHQHSGDYLISYIVLGVSFVIESISLSRAVRQVRRESRRWRTTPRRFLRLTADTTVKAVFLEDSAALIGLLLAGLGVGLSQATGDEVWDGVASILIGLLLLTVAGILASNNLSLLVGRAVPARLGREIEQELAELPEVERIDTLLTMQLGPDDILVARRSTSATRPPARPSRPPPTRPNVDSPRGSRRSATSSSTPPDRCPAPSARPATPRPVRARTPAANPTRPEPRAGPPGRGAPGPRG